MKRTDNGQIPGMEWQYHPDFDVNPPEQNMNSCSYYSSKYKFSFPVSSSGYI